MNLTSTASLPVSFDHEETWPDAVLRLLQSRCDLLTEYEEKQRPLNLMSLGQYLDAGQPTNPLAEQRDAIVREVDSLILHHNLLGYHCTRLLPHEIEEVERDGLEPLSPDLVIRRINNAVRMGHLAPDIAARFLAKNKASALNRIGQLCFTFTARALRQEGGVVDLFSNWAGEAVYNQHAESQVTGPRVRRLGVACIVEAIVPAAAVERKFGEPLIAAYLGRSRETRRPCAQGAIRQWAPVHRVIQRNDPEFARLTDLKSWDRRL